MAPIAPIAPDTPIAPIAPITHTTPIADYSFVVLLDTPVVY